VPRKFLPSLLCPFPRAVPGRDGRKITERSTQSFELRVMARRNSEREGSQLGSLLTTER